MKSYSKMDRHTLLEEIKQLKHDLTKTKENGHDFQESVLTQQLRIARSYLVDPQSITLNKRYAVEDSSHLFHVLYLNGVMAWGKWEGSNETCAIPLSSLILVDNEAAQ
ncbi:DUF1811 family protein [Hazenella sp. IB182353]|uniref:DUF1811 family protein n=1 Tax=Polycladospora coralii TaxID=2771432 RepID=UPI001746336E|nr:DUF1811 family protein [Polycladospora coralii]MBS7531328.1 DUF1811 family protein [Polycladospora coralii]